MALQKSRRERIIKRIEVKEAQRDALEDALLNGATAGGGYVLSYNFNSGEGSQQTQYRRYDEVKRMIDRLDSEIERLYRKIENTGLATINLRRKGG